MYVFFISFIHLYTILHSRDLFNDTKNTSLLRLQAYWLKTLIEHISFQTDDDYSITTILKISFVFSIYIKIKNFEEFRRQT